MYKKYGDCKTYKKMWYGWIVLTFKFLATTSPLPELAAQRLLTRPSAPY